MQDTDEKIRNMHMGLMIHTLANQMKRSNAAVDIGDAGELTAFQKHVLKFILLATLHKDIYQKDIEEEFQIRKSTVTGILKLMEKNGFIERVSDPKDARYKRLVPTPKAKALRPNIMEHICRTENRLTRGISEEELAVCKNVMCRMFCNLAEKNRENEEVERKDE